MYKYFPTGNHLLLPGYTWLCSCSIFEKNDFRISYVAVSGCALLTPQLSKRIAQLGMLNLSALFAFPIRLVAYFRIAPGPGGLAGVVVRAAFFACLVIEGACQLAAVQLPHPVNNNIDNNDNCNCN